MMDATHAGHIGNTVTVNGVVPESDNVRAGERIRLRLVNVANARVFGLELSGHDPRIVAIDGQPVEPHAPEGGRVVIAPAMRVDLVIDMAWDHPMRLHGYAFRVVTRNGAPTRYRPWQDTVLLAPEDRVEIAFLADNPGDCMFHCHILEHMAAGMMGVIRVARTAPDSHDEVRIR